MVNGHAGNWRKGLMNRINIIYYQTAGKSTIKADRIRKVGDGKSLFIKSEIGREVVTGSSWVVEDDRIGPIVPTYVNAI